MYEKLARWLIKHRIAVSLAIVVITSFFLYQALRIRVESRLTDLFPTDHPFVETFMKYKDVFGGASMVAIQLQVKEGDVFNRTTLEKITRITKALELLPAINNYQVTSLAQRKIKRFTHHPIDGLSSKSIMWPEFPQTAEGIEQVREAVYYSPYLHGSLISLDDKAAFITAGFFEKKMDPKLTYDRIQKIIAKETDANTSFSLIGRPIMLGYILTHSHQLGRLFIYSILAIIVVLAFYFRDLRGVLIPLATASISAIWGLGLLGLMETNFDILVIVVPFIISARALSHSVQLIERYLEEFQQRRDRVEASVATFKGLFRPGMTAIITDAAGVILIWLAPIPLMQKLAVMGGFWVLSIIISDMIFNPVLLALLPEPKRSNGHRAGYTKRALGSVAAWCFGWQRYPVLVITVLCLGIGLFYARHLVIGDVHPGTPMLWPNSTYNRDVAKIGDRFGSTEFFSVVVEGEKRGTIERSDVLHTMEAFQKHMEALPEVAATRSIADFVPHVLSTFHQNFPKWELIPNNPMEAAFFTRTIWGEAQPGELASLITPDLKNANISLLLKDHKGETLRKVVAKAQEFIRSNPVKGAVFRLAGGMGGLLAAINQIVAQHQAQVTVLAFTAVFLFCGIAYRSLVAGLLFLLPLLVSNYLTYALMGAMKIGLDVNTLPVIALGVGLGVDYGLYVVDRIKEEFDISQDLQQAITIAITTAGKAVVFTAVAMVAAVVCWSMSFMRFQAEMGLLLVFWMVISMVGGLILLPTLVFMMRPRFVVGKPA